MRTLASSLAALLTTVALLLAGGAWSPAASTLVPADIDPHVATARWDSMTAHESEPAPPARALPPGCRIPLVDASCPVTVVAGGLDVPRTVEDLVPERVESVEDWRPLVAAFFRPEHVDRAIRIMWCESKGDPRAKNPVSTASGLFQHLASMWEERTAAAEMGDADVFDPVANVAMAAWLVYEFGGWSHWNASSACW